MKAEKYGGLQVAWKESRLEAIGWNYGGVMDIMGERTKDGMAERDTA